MKKIIAVFTTVLLSVNLFSADLVKSSAELENKADSLYPQNDNVLYYLDSGMLNYYEGNYQTAVKKLTEAENFIDQYYTKSISRNTAAFLTNDSLLEYPGEDYEDIYTNLFKALAYYKMGKLEEGYHELNAYKRKAGAVQLRHSAELLKAREAAKAGEENPVTISFYDSALAEYLYLLYYRNIRDVNQVNFSGRMLKEVFTNSRDIYNFSVPATIDEEINTKATDTRINFVVFSGTSPYKFEDTEYYSNELILSLPELVIEKPKVQLIIVEAKNQATGKVYTQKLEQIENFGNICTDIYKAKSKVTYYKSLARALTKGGITAGSKAAGKVLADSDNTTLAILGTALSAGSSANETATYLSEHADLRHSNYFPGRADIGGISVDEGTYEIKVSYYGIAGGKPLYQDVQKNVQVKRGKLNLVSTSSIFDELSENKNRTNTKNTNTTANTVSVYDTVEKDKIYFDIGSEPDANSSTTYGIFQYNWNETIGSNVKVLYTNSTETEDTIPDYTGATQIIKNSELEIDLLPFVYSFGSNNNFSASAGFSYQRIKESTFAGMFDTNGIMLEPEDQGKYFTMDDLRQGNIFAPRIGFNASLPVNNFFGVNFQIYSNPIYVINMNQEMKYHSDHTVLPFNYGGSNSFTKVSAPYVDAKLSLDLFNFVRIVTQASYQRLALQQMDWADDFESLVGYDDNQTMVKFRVGAELLAGSKRKARVRGGVYFQNEWNTSTYTGETVSKAKMIISIGSER